MNSVFKISLQSLAKLKCPSGKKFEANGCCYKTVTLHMSNDMYPKVSYYKFDYEYININSNAKHC